MMQRPVRNLPGSEDLIGRSASRLADLEALLSGVLDRWGYEEVRTPIIEDADLFLRKSGGELAARLYRIDDPGGARAALRPEFTASTIRTFVGLDSRPLLPVRWRYAGPVFRHQGPQDHIGATQTTQVGAELIGSSSRLADVETVLIACDGIRRAGITGASIRFGHLGTVDTLLQAFGLSDRAELFLLTRLGSLRERGDAIEEVLYEARLLRVTTDGVGDGPRSPSTALMDLAPQQARAVARQLVTSLGPAWVGSRSMEDVEERLLAKLQSVEDPARLREALSLLTEISSITGDPATVMPAVQEIVQAHGLDRNLLEPAHEMARFLAASGRLDGIDVTWDFGFAPGLAYYTGLVFEIVHPDLPGWPLCSGGRYDGLINALGGPDIPALGFAYMIQAIQTALANAPSGEAWSRKRALEAVIVPRRLADSAGALAEAERIRNEGEGKTVVIYPEPGEVDAAREYALANGARTFVMIGAEGAHSVSLEDLPG